MAARDRVSYKYVIIGDQTLSLFRVSEIVLSQSYRYFSGTEPSRGHTAIYKIHKYFARRPHNKFASLIDHYVPKSGLVVDCFAGGGVTLVEGLSLDRRVVSIDSNPVAALIQRAQVSEVSAARLIELADGLIDQVPSEWRDWYTTACDNCGERAQVRWFERAYKVDCPDCWSPTTLSDINVSKGNDGRKRPGKYVCSACSSTFASIDAKRTGSELLSIRFRCGSCGEHAVKKPDEFDLRIAREVESLESSIVEKLNLRIPREPIPLTWDRQAEDALARKGFISFGDLFSSRNRLVMAHLFQTLRNIRSQLTEDELVGVLTLLSALLRYVNSMSFTTSSWMDGRPVAWAKHAFWTPNQFVEANPFEYIGHRQLALRKAETDRKSRFAGKRRSDEPIDVLDGRADYAILCADSRVIDLPDQTVDAVITDPPFGSNVQYGELTHFWSIWLEGLNPYKVPLFELSDEILVHRRRRGGKSFSDYQAGLTSVFLECYRVLKHEGVLVFTFNNRVPDAWHAVMKAAFDAGFVLEPEGIHYIDEIKAYRDTAHLRFDNELQGDVLYTFVKRRFDEPSAAEIPQRWLAAFLATTPTLENESEIAIALHVGAIREAALAIQSGASKEATLQWLELVRVASQAGIRNQSLTERCETWLREFS